jgi:hypothetical protein
MKHRPVMPEVIAAPEVVRANIGSEPPDALHVSAEGRRSCVQRSGGDVGDRDVGVPVSQERGGKPRPATGDIDDRPVASNTGRFDQRERDLGRRLKPAEHRGSRCA